MRLSSAARDAFRTWGRAGGRARARRQPAAARRAAARLAALRRWTRVRFGAPRFADLGLPGGATVDQGLEDLARGVETAESLTVSLAAPRLRREGVPLPAHTSADADQRLYALLLAREGRALAHARYLARLREIQSFADACARVRRRAGRRAQ